VWVVAADISDNTAARWMAARLLNGKTVGRITATAEALQTNCEHVL
jgi:hypothetical protein